MDRNTTVTALLAALLGAFAVGVPVAMQSSEPAHTPGEIPTVAASRSPRVAESQERPYRVLNDFLGFKGEDAKKAWTTEDERKRYTIEFLIATLPEPLAPPLRYKFDSYLDAIQRAAEAAGYIMDRFDLPWPDPNKEDSQNFKLGQEIDLRWEQANGAEASDFASITPNTKQAKFLSEPGILLFRRVQNPVKDRRLLMVFVVGETPTWGVRKEALNNALDWIAWLSDLWNEQKVPPRFPRRADEGPLHIRIVGPSFSGSAQSIDLALADWLSSHPTSPEPQIRIISGTATAIDETLRKKWANDRWAFNATAIPNSQRDQLITSYLIRQLGAADHEIAVLSESSTVFGASVSSAASSSLHLKFPLHISNLRSVSRGMSGLSMPQVELGHRNLPFSEEQSENGGYIVPMFSARGTSYDELVLNNLISTIHRERIGFVQIAAATDVEDLIFLAQQIRIYCPDTVLVTSTADIRFLHSDVNPDLRGMLVFTTYPLFHANQSWTYPFRGEEMRLQVPSDNAEGVYNAFLALLGMRERMQEYGSPFTRVSRQPPLWVTIVGRDNFWPVAILEASENNCYLYQEESHPAADPILLRRALYPRVFLVEFLILSLFCLSACTLVLKEFPAFHVPKLFAVRNDLWASLPTSLSMLSADGACASDRAVRRTVLLEYTTILLVLFGSVFLFFLIPMLPRIGFANGVIPWHPSPLVKFLVGIGWLTLSVELLAVFATLRSAWTESAFWRRIGLLLVLVSGVWAARSIAELIMAHPPQSQTAANVGVFLFLRSVNLRSGVSPLLPILMVSGAGLLLVICSLRRFNLLEACPLPKPFLNFGNGSFGGVSRQEDQIRDLLGCAPLFLPGSPLLLPLFLVIYTALTRGRPSYPIDGPFFDHALLAASFLVYAAFSLVFLRFATVWWALRRLLHRLYWHPTRGAYESLRETLPGDQSEKKRIHLLERRPSYTAIEGALQNAREILRFRDDQGLRVAVVCAEEFLQRAYKAEDEDTGNWREAVKNRLRVEQTMAAVTGAVASIFDGEWRLQAAGSASSQSAQDTRSKLVEQANLFVASRVVDFLRQVLPQLQNLAVFGTATMLLMLLAMSSYPFPQRDTFLWLSWLTLLAAVLLLLIVFVQMNRDRIVSLLSGTVPGKLSWDAGLVNQVILFGVVPALSLLGAQFPHVFWQLFSWTSKIASGH